jgi:hypothetical protein
LRNINPAIYKTAGNWGLVAVGGEYLRTTIGGYGNASWWQNELSQQLAQDSFTSNGQYQDHSGMDGLNPVPCEYSRQRNPARVGVVGVSLYSAVLSTSASIR